MGSKTKSENYEDLKLTPSEQLTLASRGYNITRKLNEGSYAKVYVAEYKTPSKNEKQTTLACKIINTSSAPPDFVQKFLPREIEMLIKLNHPHLVHTHSIFQRRNKYFIFMRYMELGDLLEYVLHKGAVPEDQARIWTRQLALAVQYMHELEVAHRDIKCENVLLTANHNAKLCDFGFARVCVDKRMREVMSETFCGSLSYTAPEILQGAPYWPKPTDVWSLGVVTYVMLNRAMPFQDKQITQLYQAQINKSWNFRPRCINVLSDNCKTIITQMLDPNFRTRIKIDQIIVSPWISMDPRLLEWTPQERNALKKATEERKQLRRQNKAGSVQQSSGQQETMLPSSSILKRSADSETASTSMGTSRQPNLAQRGLQSGTHVGGNSTHGRSMQTHRHSSSSTGISHQVSTT